MRADENKKNRIDLFDKYPLVFDDPAPLPGSSIGPVERSTCTGTLSLYLEHCGEIYALTNEHVVNGYEATVLGTRQSYKYLDGMEKHYIHSPSDADCESTRALQKERLELFEKMKTTDKEYYQKKKAIIDNIIEEQKSRIKKIDNYDREFGYVVLTSGSLPPSTPQQPRQDWALISLTKRGGKIQFRNNV